MSRTSSWGRSLSVNVSTGALTTSGWRRKIELQTASKSAPPCAAAVHRMRRSFAVSTTASSRSPAALPERSLYILPPQDQGPSSYSLITCGSGAVQVFALWPSSLHFEHRAVFFARALKSNRPCQPPHHRGEADDHRRKHCATEGADPESPPGMILSDSPATPDVQFSAARASRPASVIRTLATAISLPTARGSMFLRTVGHFLN
jgi:hypothetical protein